MASLGTELETRSSLRMVARRTPVTTHPVHGAQGAPLGAGTCHQQAYRPPSRSPSSRLQGGARGEALSLSPPPRHPAHPPGTHRVRAQGSQRLLRGRPPLCPQTCFCFSVRRLCMEGTLNSQENSRQVFGPVLPARLWVLSPLCSPLGFRGWKCSPEIHGSAGQVARAPEGGKTARKSQGARADRGRDSTPSLEPQLQRFTHTPAPETEGAASWGQGVHGARQTGGHAIQLSRNTEPEPLAPRDMGEQSLQLWAQPASAPPQSRSGHPGPVLTCYPEKKFWVCAPSGSGQREQTKQEITESQGGGAPHVHGHAHTDQAHAHRHADIHRHAHRPGTRTRTYTHTHTQACTQARHKYIMDTYVHTHRPGTST